MARRLVEAQRRRVPVDEDEAWWAAVLREEDQRER